MIEEGSIELIDNPAHKKSKLLRITAKGEALFQDLTERNAQAAELLAQDMDAVELEIAVKVMRQLRDKLKKSILI
jgi:DNA-binding MarR family transcriptional regulator